MSLLKAGGGLSCVLKVNSASQRLTLSFFEGGGAERRGERLRLHVRMCSLPARACTVPPLNRRVRSQVWFCPLYYRGKAALASEPVTLAIVQWVGFRGRWRVGGGRGLKLSVKAALLLPVSAERCQSQADIDLRIY